MNYIGSKYKLLSFLKSTIDKTVGSLEGKVFCDLFSGTGVVAQAFKPTCSVIANDIEYYSYVLNQHYIQNNIHTDIEELIKHLNSLDGIEGFIFKHYAKDRMYFSEDNAKKIDAIRQEIRKLYLNKEVTSDVYYTLLTSLLEASDKVANTASVYAAYLKNIKLSASKPIQLNAPKEIIGTGVYRVYKEDANELVKSISGDILYLDPPYNSRQYGANYHMLNTIAEYNTEFTPRGVSGMRDYFKSQYCSKRTVAEALTDLLKHAQFKYVFLSYNNEGLLSLGDIQSIMSKLGKYRRVCKEYQRFKSDTKREQVADKTIEYLHILEKRN